MIQRNNLLFIIVHTLALFLSYAAVCIIIYHWFKIDVPFPETIKNSNFLAIGTFFLLPVLGVVCIRYHANFLLRLIGYVYVMLWLLVMLRLLSILFNK